ncbi:MAG TPA: hypothetical protein VF783_11335, partial [Terriglobales bacterium]
KLLPQPLGMVRLDFRLRSSPEELLDTLVPEALYHPYSVYYRYTFGQPYVSYLPFLLGTLLFAIILSACKLNSLQRITRKRSKRCRCGAMYSHNYSHTPVNPSGETIFDSTPAVFFWT